ncbi:hypothetical protein F4818DRAFT_455261 [Hypoxylon cercidicola]|nr:hypothetical protein F4818DRAFT_455261 [Hypoxylon cercidicola]
MSAHIPYLSAGYESGKTILIWESSSAVGSNGIQLAKAAGFNVIATCSPRSFEYVKSLGVRKVFDYNSPSVANGIVAELDKGVFAGTYIATGDVRAAEAAKMALAGGPIDRFKEILPVTFGGFLPEVLARGLYKIAPRPEVISTKGLEGIQEALDILKRGVSAKKLVVEG